MLPGDVVVLMFEEKAYAKDLEALRAKLGLDRPLYIQYFSWLGQVVTGEPRGVAVDEAAGAGGDYAPAPGQLCSSAPWPSL